MARNRYSVPCERVGQWVSSRQYPSRVVVIADEAIIASHEHLLGRDQLSFDWQHYIPLIERSPERCAMALRLPICRSRCCFSSAV